MTPGESYLSIAYDADQDWFVVRFFNGTVRHYGNVPTVLGMLTDYYAPITQAQKRRSKIDPPHIADQFPLPLNQKP